MPPRQFNRMNVGLPPYSSSPAQREHVIIFSGDGSSQHGITVSPWGVFGATSGLIIHLLLPLIPVGFTSSEKQSWGTLESLMTQLKGGNSEFVKVIF